MDFSCRFVVFIDEKFLNITWIRNASFLSFCNLSLQVLQNCQLPFLLLILYWSSYSRFSNQLTRISTSSSSNQTFPPSWSIVFTNVSTLFAPRSIILGDFSTPSTVEIFLTSTSAIWGWGGVWQPWVFQVRGCDFRLLFAAKRQRVCKLLLHRVPAFRGFLFSQLSSWDFRRYRGNDSTLSPRQVVKSGLLNRFIRVSFLFFSFFLFRGKGKFRDGDALVKRYRFDGHFVRYS